MPFNVLITFLVGSILGWIVVQFTRPPSHFRGLIVGCCAAGLLKFYNTIYIYGFCYLQHPLFHSRNVFLMIFNLCVQETWGTCLLLLSRQFVKKKEAPLDLLIPAKHMDWLMSLFPWR